MRGARHRHRRRRPLQFGHPGKRREARRHLRLQAGDARDLPVVGVALDAIFRSDPSGRCTALDVIDLALGFSGAALEATLDGVPLASLLGVGGSSSSSSSLVVVHLAGPAPAPLLKAESYFRHQVMVRFKAMSRLATALSQLEAEATLPEDIRLVIDVDPVNLA